MWSAQKTIPFRQTFTADRLRISVIALAGFFATLSTGTREAPP
jgi:hypothetical protein